MSRVMLALAQYPIGQFADPAAWRRKLEQWVGEAARAGAQLLLFPEYASMELASLLTPALQADLQGQIHAMQEFLPAYRRAHADLARSYGITLVAGTFPVRTDDGGRFVNRAHVYAPDGAESFQDKRQMTRFEGEGWGISPGVPQSGGGLKVFNTGLGVRFGIAVCYDVEFPLITHALSEAGADLVLAPSCTDALAGLNRVHIGARARALENQICVAVAQTVGEARWSPAVDVNVGRAAAYCTPDRGLPDNGILAQGETNHSGWVYATPDFALLRAARAEAQVFTRSDWAKQDKPDLTVRPAEFTAPE